MAPSRHWDATAEPGAAERARRSDAFDDRLRELGFTPIGVLGADAGWQGSVHPELVRSHLAVWRSVDGAITAEVDHLYGLDTVELVTLLDDGTSLLTYWAPRDDGVPPGWYRGDPRCGPPRGPAVWLQSDMGLARSVLTLGHPAGQRRRRVDGPDVAAAVEAHRTWVAEHREHGPVVPLDVAGLAVLSEHVYDAWTASILSRGHGPPRTVGLVMAAAIPIFALLVLLPLRALTGWNGEQAFSALIGLVAGVGTAGAVLAMSMLLLGAGRVWSMILVMPIAAVLWTVGVPGWSLPGQPFWLGAGVAELFLTDRKIFNSTTRRLLCSGLDC